MYHTSLYEGFPFSLYSSQTSLLRCPSRAWCHRLAITEQARNTSTKSGSTSVTYVISYIYIIWDNHNPQWGTSLSCYHVILLTEYTHTHTHIYIYIYIYILSPQLRISDYCQTSWYSRKIVHDISSEELLQSEIIGTLYHHNILM